MNRLHYIKRIAIPGTNTHTHTLIYASISPTTVEFKITFNAHYLKRTELVGDSCSRIFVMSEMEILLFDINELLTHSEKHVAHYQGDVLKSCSCSSNASVLLFSDTQVTCRHVTIVTAITKAHIQTLRQKRFQTATNQCFWKRWSKPESGRINLGGKTNDGMLFLLQLLVTYPVSVCWRG